MQTQAPILLEQGQFILWHGILVSVQFPYQEALLHGRPQHKMDDFAFHHPPMERGKRAKIFSAFDALDGYGENIASKNTVYTDKIILDESEKEDLNRRLGILHKLTYNSRMAKANRVIVTVRYYAPCTDEYSFSCGIRGQYEEVTGIVRKVDMENQTIAIGQCAVSFDDILSITAKDEKLFNEWDETSHRSLMWGESCFIECKNDKPAHFLARITVDLQECKRE